MIQFADQRADVGRRSANQSRRPCWYHTVAWTTHGIFDRRCVSVGIEIFRYPIPFHTVDRAVGDLAIFDLDSAHIVEFLVPDVAQRACDLLIYTLRKR